MSTSNLKMPYAMCRGKPVWAHSCQGAKENKLWYRCPVCDKEAILYQGKKRNVKGKVIRNHFKHKSKSACKGGCRMSYQHKMTQLALQAYRGPLTLYCCHDDCDGSPSQVTGVELECPRVRPYKIDAVLTTTKSPVAVEVTYKHETGDDRWAQIERVFGKANTVDINVKNIEVEEDGSFYLPHAGGTKQFVTVDKNRRNPEINPNCFSSLILRSRIEKCEDCTTRQTVRDTLTTLIFNVEKKSRQDELEELKREGFVECKKCHEFKEKGEQKTYYDLEQRREVTNCCGWIICAECGWRPITCLSRNKKCIKCRQRAAPHHERTV